MTMLSLLPRPALAALVLWALSLVMLFLLATLHRASARHLIPAVRTSLGMAVSYLAMQCPLTASATPLARFGQVPTAAYVLALVVLSAWAAACHAALRRSERESVSPRSVKAAVDALPLGMLYYHESGLVKLANSAIDDLSWQTRALPLQDGRAFWEDLCPQGGDAAEVRTKDGRSFALARSEVLLHGTPFLEVIATDVTAQRAINSQIERENELLRETSDRLREWSQVAADVTTAREVVEAKARVHDELGRASIACRRYLERGGTAEDLDAMLSQWGHAIGAIRSREARLASHEEQALESIFEAARSVGLRLHVEGELPRTAPAARAVVAVCMEALLNASQHAHASALLVRCERRERTVAVTVRDDGEPPTPDAREGGGLAIARSRVESAGGTMLVEWQPSLVIRCTLPDNDGGSDSHDG